MISTLAEKEKRSINAISDYIGHWLLVQKATVLVKKQFKPLIDAACPREKTRLYEQRRQTINAIKS